MTNKKHHQTDPKSDDTTGTYVFDKKLGKVVKVSSRVPKVSSKGQGGGFDDAPGAAAATAAPRAAPAAWAGWEAWGRASRSEF